MKSEECSSLIVCHTRFPAFSTKGPDPVRNRRTVMELMAASEAPRELFKGITGAARESSHGKQEKIRFQAREWGWLCAGR